MNGMLAAAIVFAILANAARSDTTMAICASTASFFTVIGVLLWAVERFPKR